MTMSNVNLLLSYLSDGAIKYEDACRRLQQSGKLTLGVSPGEVISLALERGRIATFNDGNKTWIRRPAPFVHLERGSDRDSGVEYLAYSAKNDRGVCSQRLAIQPHPDQQIEVQWPDGTVTVETVAPQAYGAIPGLHIAHRGVRAWIPLDSPGLKVRADAF